MIRVISYLMIVCLALAMTVYHVRPGDARQPEATPTPTVLPVEEIALLIKNADASFARQEFTACYDLYAKVLGLDPFHEHARAQIAALIKMYQQLAENARQDGNQETVALYTQKYRDAVRETLRILTSQLKQQIQQYGELTAAGTRKTPLAEHVVPMLQKIVGLLRDIKTIYAEFPLSDSETKNIEERLNQTIRKYEQELETYRHSQ